MSPFKKHTSDDAATPKRLPAFGPRPAGTEEERDKRGRLHHVEIWVPDLDRAVRTIGWLLIELGYLPFQTWATGRSWRLEESHIVLEQSPDLTATLHRRTDPGLNHLAFHAGSSGDVDALVKEAAGRGWALLFADRHPHAGGPNHYAAYLENDDGFEVELIARPGS